MNQMARGFLLGLLAGEGSYFVTFAKDDRYEHNLVPGIRCQINMGHFSKPLLEAVQETVKLGSVTNHGKGYARTVSSRTECHELRSTIDTWLEESEKEPFQQSQKHEAYRTWKVALEIFQPGESLDKAELIELAALKDDINRVPGGGARSTDEIIDILEE
jgi:hypothetical protein